MESEPVLLNSPAILIDSLNAEKLPIKESELIDFINDQHDKSINELIDAILKLLSSKSSKFKYIINSTSIIINENANNKIKNSFGSLWDEKNDGLLTLKFKSDNSTWNILNILFISI